MLHEGAGIGRVARNGIPSDSNCDLCDPVATVLPGVRRASTPVVAARNSNFVGRGFRPVIGKDYMVEQTTTVYIANLPWGATEDDVAGLFRDFGPILDVRIIQDPRTGRSRGYGFVELTSPDNAAKAVCALDGTAFNGRALMVSNARPKPRRQ